MTSGEERLGAVLGAVAVYLLALAAHARFAPGIRGEWARSGFVVLMFTGIFALLNKPRAEIAAAILLAILAVAWPWIAPQKGAAKRAGR